MCLYVPVYCIMLINIINKWRLWWFREIYELWPGLCVLLQKAVVSPNPFKIKTKNSPIIEKLQVDATCSTDLWETSTRETSTSLNGVLLVYCISVVYRLKLSGVFIVRRLRYLKHYCHPLFIWFWCLSCSHAEKKGKGLFLLPKSAQINELMGSRATQPLVHRRPFSWQFTRWAAMGQKGCRFSLFLFSPVQVGYQTVAGGLRRHVLFYVLISQSEYGRCFCTLKGMSGCTSSKWAFEVGRWQVSTEHKSRVFTCIIDIFHNPYFCGSSRSYFLVFSLYSFFNNTPVIQITWRSLIFPFKYSFYFLIESLTVLNLTRMILWDNLSFALILGSECINF